MPLLEHADEGVRTVAAGGLWQSHPHLAIPVLKHVDRYGMTEASGLAMSILMFHGRLNSCRSDPRYEHLEEDENGIYAWDDPAFRSRVLEGKAPSVFALKTPKLCSRLREDERRDGQRVTPSPYSIYDINIIYQRRWNANADRSCRRPYQGAR